MREITLPFANSHAQRSVESIVTRQDEVKFRIHAIVNHILRYYVFRTTQFGSSIVLQGNNSIARCYQSTATPMFVVEHADLASDCLFMSCGSCLPDPYTFVERKEDRREVDTATRDIEIKHVASVGYVRAPLFCPGRASHHRWKGDELHQTTNLRLSTQHFITLFQPSPTPPSKHSTPPRQWSS